MHRTRARTATLAQAIFEILLQFLLIVPCIVLGISILYLFTAAVQEPGESIPSREGAFLNSTLRAILQGLRHGFFLSFVAAFFISLLKIVPLPRARPLALLLLSSIAIPLCIFSFYATGQYIPASEKIFEFLPLRVPVFLHAETLNAAYIFRVISLCIYMCSLTVVLRATQWAFLNILFSQCLLIAALFLPALLEIPSLQLYVHSILAEEYIPYITPAFLLLIACLLGLLSFIFPRKEENVRRFRA